jgi:MFS family permease
MGVATISLALAIGQFTWGAVQPIAGAVADRYGSQRVLVAGTLILAAGCAITPFMNGGFGLTVALGLLVSIGSGIGSFSVLLGAATNRLPLMSSVWATRCVLPRKTEVIGYCISDFLRVVFTSLFWSRIYRVKWLCVGSPRRWPAGHWQLSA